MPIMLLSECTAASRWFSRLAVDWPGDLSGDDPVAQRTDLGQIRVDARHRADDVVLRRPAAVACRRCSVC